MTQNDYILLIYKNLKGEITLEEQTSLQAWLNASEVNRTFEEKVVREWELSQNYAPKIELDAKADFATLRQRIHAEKDREKGAVIVSMQTKRRRSFLRIAAAVAVLLTGTWWFFLQSNKVELLMAQTSAGEQKTIRLADGTGVTLNEHSTLHYPATFDKKTRKVQLEGEGYFEVAKNKEKPFLIAVNSLNIKVLGTAFNVQENRTAGTISVDVSEGKVQVSANKQELILTKNQAAIYTESNQSLKQYDPQNDNSAAWKTGVLRYKNAPLKDIIADVEQHLNIKVTIVDEQMKDCPTSGQFFTKIGLGILNQITAKYSMARYDISENEFRLEGGVCE